MQAILNHLLSINIFSPFIGILINSLFYLFGRYSEKNDATERLNSCFGKIWPIYIGFLSSLIPLIISFCFLFGTDKFLSKIKLTEKFTLIKSMGIEYYLDIDGTSILMIALTSFSILICLVVFLQNKKYSSKNTILGVNMILFLEVCCLGAFLSKDLLLFYIFFEASLIPMIFIIGIWGREERVFASIKLFIYTVFGSLFLLFAIIYLKVYFKSTDPDILQTALISMPAICRKILWICLFIAFAIKIPMIPFHTWLPDAHVQAPTFGSIILASVLIKMGAYAMIKFLIPILPEETLFFSKIVCVLSVGAIIYASLICIAQKDLKKLIAYSSVAHMGYVTLGIFSPCGIGYSGALFQMISHGFISSALFYSLGIIYDKFKTFEISKISSIAVKMPFFSFAFMIFLLGSIGLPATSGFIGEFLVIMNSISRPGYMIYGILGATGVIFGAIYMLNLFRNAFLMKNENNNQLENNNKDIYLISKSEMGVLFIFIFIIIFYGIRPNLILNKTEKIKNISYINCNPTHDHNLKSTIENNKKTIFNNIN